MTSPQDTSQRDTDEPHGPARRNLWWALLIGVLGVIITAAAMRDSLQLRADKPASSPMARSPGQLPVLGEISDFTLTERSRKKITRRDLDGTVTIVDFMFTHCASICPVMTSRMKSLQDTLPADTPVRFVSISVDPLRDTPDALTQYARRHHADPDRWWFLTGDPKVIYRLCQQNFKLSAGPLPPDRRQPDMDPVMHSSRFVLLDRRARIRGYYDGTSTDAVNDLKRDINKLLDR